MLTPQEVSERAFQKASFGGYNMGQVDEFLDLLTSDYTALYNENAVLKNKMKVLVEKVEEYRSTEEAMRKALMTAQKMADEMLRDAEEKAAAITANAEAEARNRAQELHKEIEAEQFRLTAAQSATAAYVARVRAVHEKELAYLAQLNELAPETVAPQVDEVEETASEIDDSVQRLLAQAMAEATAENLKEKVAQEAPQAEDLSDTAEFIPVGSEQMQAQPQSQPEQPAAPQSRNIDFGNLQFGRDYEIK